MDQCTNTVTSSTRGGGRVMNQLRLDPLTGRWVVVSIDRAERPDNFAPPAPVQADTTGPCPFCAGNEGSTPPALETYGSRALARAGRPQPLPRLRG